MKTTKVKAAPKAKTNQDKPGDSEAIFREFLRGVRIGRMERQAKAYFTGYQNGYSDRDATEQALREGHVSPVNCDDPVLRIVSNGEKWAVEQTKKVEKVEDDTLMVRTGIFQHTAMNTKHHRIVEATELLKRQTPPESCCEYPVIDPITFLTREAAVDWVRREFGEAGLRSLKKNAEFRPA